jgi:hypothetical protein
VTAFGLRDRVDELVVLVHAQHAVRRQALDRERAGHSDLPWVGIRLVVEVFLVGIAGDRGVDLALARDAGLPPTCVEAPGLGGPTGIGLAWDLPLLPVFSECCIEALVQRLQDRLVPLPDNVNLGVVGDRF